MFQRWSVAKIRLHLSVLFNQPDQAPDQTHFGGVGSYQKPVPSPPPALRGKQRCLYPSKIELYARLDQASRCPWPTHHRRGRLHRRVLHILRLWKGKGLRLQSSPQTPIPSCAPGQADHDEDPFAPHSLGNRRGHPVLPSFCSWMSFLKPSPLRRRRPPAVAAHRLRSHPKRPIFRKREDFSAPPGPTQSADPEEVAPLPRSLSPLLSGSGRGKPTQQAEPESPASEENQHLRPRAPIGVLGAGRSRPSRDWTARRP